MREITIADLKKLIEDRESFILHFWAEWNGYDVQQKLIFDEVLSLRPSLQYFQMNADPEENWECCKQHQVYGPPTIVYYREGLLIERVVGVQTVEKIINTLERVYV